MHPYQWIFERETTWYRYYAALLVALVAALGWALEGGSLARSVGQVWELLLLLAAICIAMWWKMARNYADRETQLGHWALRELQRHEADKSPDPLSWPRREAFP